MTPAQGLLCRSWLLSLHLPVCRTHKASLFISITNLWHCARAKHPKTPSLSQIVTCWGGPFCSGWSREGCSSEIAVVVGFLAEERISLGLINEEDGPKWVQRTGSLRPLSACSHQDPEPRPLLTVSPISCFSTSLQAYVCPCLLTLSPRHHFLTVTTFKGHF